MKKRLSRIVVAAAVALTAAVPSIVDADTLVVLNKAETTASLIDLSSGEVRATLPTGSGPHEAAVSPKWTDSVAHQIQEPQLALHRLADK
jgi:hypothetical protein